MVDVAKKGLPLGYSYQIGQARLHYTPNYDFYAECKTVTQKELLDYYRKGGTANYAEAAADDPARPGHTKSVVRWLEGDWKNVSNKSRDAVVYRVASVFDAPLHREGRVLSGYSSGTMMPGDIEIGAPLYDADGMANLVFNMKNIFLEQGYLPHDDVWSPKDLLSLKEPTSVLPPLWKDESTNLPTRYEFFDGEKNRFQPTALRIVWFYALNLGTVDSRGVVQTQDRNLFFARSFVVMGCKGDPSSSPWFPSNSGGESDCLIRQWGASNNLPIAFPQNAAPYKVDQSLGRWLESNEEVILDAAVVLIELVVIAFTAGAATPFIQLINPFIFGMIHAACTGDGQQLLRGIMGAYQQFAAQVKLNQSAILDEVAQNNPKTVEFYGRVSTIVGEIEDKLTGVVKSVRATVDGVGFTMGDIADKGQKVLLDDLKKIGTLDPSATINDLVTTFDKKTGLPLSSGTALGSSMLKATYQKAMSEVTKAVTDDVSSVVRQTQGVLGWAHDIGQSIDFKEIAKRLPQNAWPIKVVDPKTGETVFTNTKALDDILRTELSRVMTDNAVPRYAEQAVFFGASFKLLNTIQKREFEPEVQFRSYKQTVTEYKSGFIPDELVAAYKEKGLTVKTAKPSVSPNLANLDKGISGGMTKVTSKQMLAANAGVTFNEVGAAPWQVLGGAALVAAALYAMRKKGGVNVPNAAIAAGSGLAALGVWYGLRGTIHGRPMLVPAVDVGSTLKIEGGIKAMSLGAGGAPTTYTRTVKAGYGIEAPSGASLGPSTDNLVILSDPAHQFTVAEVQYLLGLYGATPKLAVNGQWSDDAVKAVRDWQTRIFKQNPWANIIDVNGNPFEPKSSTQLRQFALKLLLDPKHVITVGEAQALLQVPITGKEDAATKAKMAKSAVTGPIASPSVQTWLRNLASGVTQFGGGYF